MSFFGQEFRSQKKQEEDDFYYSNDGYIIFTEKYHLKRGTVVKATASTVPMDMILKQEK